MSRLQLHGFSAATLLCLFIYEARGEIVALDNAGSAQYSWEVDGAWKGISPSIGENPPGTDNGGDGFLPWNFAGGYHQPEFSPYGQLNHFIDSVDFPASSYNNLGVPAFGLTNANLAFGGHTARATRSFASPLEVGDTLLLDFDNPLLTPLNLFAPSGFLIRLNTGLGPVISGSPASATERFGIATTSDYLNGRWFTTDASGLTDTGVAPSATNSGTQFRFALQSDETYLAEFLRISDRQVLFSKTGSLAAIGEGAIDSIEITMFSNGSGNGLIGEEGMPTGQREFFFSELRIDQAANSMSNNGDHNLDGLIDAADYVVWRDTLGELVTLGTGADGHRDGKIDMADYEVWKSFFGTENASATISASSVPEPGAEILYLVSLMTFMVIRARRCP